MASLSRFLGRLFASAGQRPAFPRYGLAVLLPFAAMALTSAFITYSRAPFFSFFSLAVVVASIYGGTRPGLLATGLCFLLNALALPPTFSIRVSNPGDLWRMIAFAAVGVTLAVLIGSAGQIQHRLDIERRRLDVTLRSIGDAVIATDVRGRITFMNWVAEQATGWKQDEAAGCMLQDVFKIVNEKTRATVQNPVEKVLREGRVVGLANHTILIRKDGSEILIDDSAAPIVNAGVLTGVVLVFRDVTETRVNEAALLRAEKLASVGRLAATVAHEINNPLEAVTNLLYLIRSSNDVAAIHGLTQAAEQELARASHVTRQTLSFARQAGKPESVNIPAIVDSITDLYDNKFKARDIAVVKTYRSAGMANASANDVAQVISNLLSNAVDAEAKGGRIDVRVVTSEAQNAVRLTVADRGCGMTREQMGRLYEPFFTTKQDVGTGLGLWVTKQIVDSAGARIRVRSTAGRGTVFMVCWPIAEVRTEDKALAAEE